MSTRSLLTLLHEPGWDAPFFKKLAHNDTGQSKGHQSGVVIPKSLRAFFPQLDVGRTSIKKPTVDRRLAVKLYILDKQVGEETVRYQFQTWKNTRPPESRLTDNLGPLYNSARAGDLLVVQRLLRSLEVYRLILVPRGCPSFKQLSKLSGDRPWGYLMAKEQPLTQDDLVAARKDMAADLSSPFTPIRSSTPRSLSTRNAIARDLVFRETLLSEYQRCCAISGISLETDSAVEVEAAHVIPLGKGGPDEPRNGLALTGTLHWAFDRGLFGIDEKRRVMIPRSVLTFAGNAWLMQFSGRQITEAKSHQLKTAEEAFAWHRVNVVSRWL